MATRLSDQQYAKWKDQRDFLLREQEAKTRIDNYGADNRRADEANKLNREKHELDKRRIEHEIGLPKVYGSAERGYYTIEGGKVKPITDMNAPAPTTKVIKQQDGSEVAVQWDPKADNPQTGAKGTWIPLQAPQGGNPVTSPKLTEQQSKDLNYYNRGKAAEDEFAPLQHHYADGFARVMDKAPFGVGNYAQTDEFQKSRTAGLNFLSSILRKDSGAAIPPHEIETYGKMFLPQPGDKPGNIDLLARMRKEALESLKSGLGPAQILANAAETRRKIESEERGRAQQQAPADTTLRPGGSHTMRQIWTKKEYDDLPSGMTFIDPKGQPRVKP
jgi:hypothetical protein